LGRPTTLSTRYNDLECIDYFLNLRDQPLATFLTANKKGGKITQDLKLNFCPFNHIPRPLNLPPALADFELLKVLGTGGFS
jgi:hypothetical protein